MGSWLPDQQVRAHALEAGVDAAVIDGSVRWTWADLDERVDALAGELVRAGIAAGAIAALLAGPSAPAIAALLAILRAGAVAAPIPGGLTGRELAAAFDVVDPALILHDSALTSATAGLGRRTMAIEVVAHPAVEVVDRRAIKAFGDAGPAAGRDPGAPAVIVLTSGTTGSPRGVVLSARAMAASAESWLGALPPATGWLLALGLGHVAGLGVLWRAMARRVPLRIVPPAEPATQLAAMIGELPPSHVSLVPGQLARLLDARGEAPAPPALRAVLLGGGPIPPALVTRAVLAGWPVVPTYGLTETGSGVTALPIVDASLYPGSAGPPLPGVRIRIDEPDADGVGEIVVETEARFSGYVGGAARPTSITEPVRTGDLGRLDGAGRLFVVDRRLDRIVRGGENIAPAEVEAVLLEHPVVADAAVVGRPHPLWGQVPVAAIVLRDGDSDPGDEALAAHCRTSLAGFKVPEGFVRLDVLPRTAGGKLRREAVRALLAGERTGQLARPGGDALGWRVTGTGALPLVLLHGTLSTAAQLDRLAAALASSGDVTVHALDRRGSGTGRLSPARPLDVATHVADLVAYLDARAIERAILVGASFGGVLAIETAARRPERVAAVVAYEPPYGPLADPATQDAFVALSAAVTAAHGSAGAPAAAETFLRRVAGDAAWDRLPERGRAFLARAGDGALADAGLTGLDPAGLARIEARVTILTGGASEPFYARIADALAARIAGASRAVLPGLAHPAPITEPATVAGAIRAALASAGLVTARPAVPSRPAASAPAPATTPTGPEAR